MDKIKKMYKIINILNREYILYSTGEIFDVEVGVFRKAHKNSRGYMDYTFSGDGIQSIITVHRLIAEAFIPNPKNKPCIDHINTVKDDNRIENLRWCTQQENMNNPITYERVNNAKKKSIAGFDKNGNEVCRFNSLKEARNEGYSCHIAQVANGKRYKSNNLFWRWL